MVVRGCVLLKEKTTPNFTLKDQDNKQIRLSDLGGRRVVSSFYTVPVGISINSVLTNKA